jgi:transposase-like protein
MRYPASEKLEIIQLVEQSHLPVRRALEQIGIPRSTFYRRRTVSKRRSNRSLWRKRPCRFLEKVK